MNTVRHSTAGSAIVLIASLLGAVLIGSCGKSSAPAGSQTGRRQGIIPVQVNQIQIGALTADRATSGQIVPVTQSQVAAQVAGVVTSTPRLAGDWVRTGDLVVQLDPAQFKLAVANAQAALDNAQLNLDIGLYNVNQANPKLALDVQSGQSALEAAQKNYDAQKALYALGGTSASQLDTARTQLSQAQSSLEAAKTALDQNQK